MSAFTYWLNFLKCQKEIIFHKLKIYGINQKIEDNYRMIGEEVYLFSQKPKSHKSILSQGRVKFLLNEVTKDQEIIAETEKEISERKEDMMGVSPEQEVEQQPEASNTDLSEGETAPKAEELESSSQALKEDKE